MTTESVGYFGFRELAKRHVRMGGFTVVELLVVITIMTLLVSMLLPSVQNAREVTQATVCKSRMSQLGMAINTYTSDNHNRYPYGAWRPWVAPTQTWDTLINDYMGAIGPTLSAGSYNYPLLICPKDPKKPNAVFANRSYVMTNAISGNANLYVAANGPGVPPHSVGLDDVVAPAGTFLLVEAPNSSTGRSYYGNTAETPGEQCAPLLSLTNPAYASGFTVVSAYPANCTTHPKSQYNYLYADNHIAMMYPLDTDTRAGILGAPRAGMRGNNWYTVGVNSPGSTGWTLNPND